MNHVGLFADGVAVKRVGEEPFRLAQEVVDEVILVNTDEICAAIEALPKNCAKLYVYYTGHGYKEDGGGMVTRGADGKPAHLSWAMLRDKLKALEQSQRKQDKRDQRDAANPEKAADKAGRGGRAGMKQRPRR